MDLMKQTHEFMYGWWRFVVDQASGLLNWEMTWRSRNLKIVLYA